MKKKRPIRNFVITHKTRLGEIFDLNTEETKRIIKQMEVYGLHSIGYGIDYSKTISQHAEDQSINSHQLTNLLKSLNRKL